jgi:SAM-dependent methyltransferase
VERGWRAPDTTVLNATAAVDTETIRRLILPIRGYDSRKRELLRAELQRLCKSLELVPAHRGGRLLDLGSSGTLVPVYVRELGYERVSCIDLAGGAGRRRLVHDDGSIFEYDAYPLNLDSEPYPFADAGFDQVVCMEVIEHLCADPMFMLAEVNRVLKPGGRLLLTTPNIASLASVYSLLWGRHPAVGRQTYGPGITDRHNREYTPQEVELLLRAAGINVERLDTFDPVPPSAPVTRVGRLLRLLRVIRSDIECNLRGRVIRCAGVKVGNVAERFPEVIYPRYAYYDYAAYDDALKQRFDGRRYWDSNVLPDAPEPIGGEPAGTPACTTA